VALAVATPQWRTPLRGTAGLIAVARGKSAALSDGRAVTTFGTAGAWTVRGSSCRIAAASSGAVSVAGRAPGWCTVTVSAPGIRGRVAALSASWTVAVR
ncbi:MAG: hypothetical protein QOJ50_113, partial [Cryptosporangiaceae bacterium]|nr:hypothetical protein [Cryptosporangiaceae bacterium]